MRARAESETWLAAPVFQVVLRSTSGERPIRDFVVHESSGRQCRARRLVKISHRIVRRHRTRAIFVSADDDLFAETAAVVYFQKINGNVSGPQCDQFSDGRFPSGARLMRQT